MTRLWSKGRSSDCCRSAVDYPTGSELDRRRQTVEALNGVLPPKVWGVWPASGSPKNSDDARSLHGRVDVQVAVEEVVRVIATLDLGEALECRWRIGASEALIPVVAEEADIGRIGAV